ncbi:MAG TPA: 2-oxoglutarate dehydrogenase, E2 component, dihydrolipoamide succinyltransferase [Actinomycetota bacterium]
MTTIKMPQLGETIIEGTILKWLKAEGETIERDEPLFEISTDKVDTEVPSPVAGTVSKIIVAEGETVPVGTDLATIDEGGDEAAGDGDGEQAPAEAPAAEQPAAAAADEAPAPPTPASPAPAPSEPAARPAAASAGSLPDRGPRSQILSPLVRRLADEHGLDLAQLQGTGTGGRITKKDVLAAVASGGTAGPAAPAQAAPSLQAVPQAAPGSGEEVVPMSHIRKAIATHMLGSLQTSARAWNMVEVDMEEIVRLRARVKEDFKAREGFNLTYTPFVTRATVDALLAYPMVNAELRGEQIVVKHYVNMGVAVSYDEGLIVPVVKGADGMNLVGLARSINDLAMRARAKQLKPDEVTAATFTITNPGPFGSILSVPIINQPNVGILAFDAIEKRVAVVNDAIAIRHRVYLSMSWDHRVIDGALASQFLARVKENLETWDFAGDLGI